MRENLRPSNLLNPLPVVLVSCTDEKGKNNVLTAAWVGTICSEPVMLSVSIRKSRYSHAIIKKSKELVINLPNEDLALFTDFAGIYSGKNVDKFNQDGKYKVTPIKSKKVKAVTIAEAPIALECVVKDIIELGSHDMFICGVVSTSVDKKIIDSSGKINFKKANLISYCHGEYYTLGKKLGKFGYSSSKKERSRRVDLKNKTKNKTKGK